MMRWGVLAACALMACDDGDPAATPAADAAVGDAISVDAAADMGAALPDPPAAGTWIEISPGGDTVCSRGTPYSFYVRGGAPDRVIVDFQGGGACWNDFTCSVADSLFSDRVAGLDAFLSFADQASGSLFDPAGPFGDWTIVHVPYCTGDIHWGDAQVEYSNENTINHRGYVNARAALDWVESHYAMPEKVFVSGCSAGAYGAILHSAYLANHYTDSQVTVLADSGAGIITDSFLNDSLPNWNAQANLPTFVPGLDVAITDLTLPDLYINIARHFPQHRFAQTATAYDADQIFFYGAMGGNRHAWPPAFRMSLAGIEAAVPTSAPTCHPARCTARRPTRSSAPARSTASSSSTGPARSSRTTPCPTASSARGRRASRIPSARAAPRAVPTRASASVASVKTGPSASARPRSSRPTPDGDGASDPSARLRAQVGQRLPRHR